MIDIKALKVVIEEARANGINNRETGFKDPLTLKGDRFERFVEVLPRKVFAAAKDGTKAAVMALDASDLSTNVIEDTASQAVLLGDAGKAFLLCKELDLNPSIHLIQKGDGFIVVEPF